MSVNLALGESIPHKSRSPLLQPRHHERLPPHLVHVKENHAGSRYSGRRRYSKILNLTMVGNAKSFSSNLAAHFHRHVSSLSKANDVDYRSRTRLDCHRKPHVETSQTPTSNRSDIELVSGIRSPLMSVKICRK